MVLKHLVNMLLLLIHIFTLKKLILISHQLSTFRLDLYTHIKIIKKIIKLHVLKYTAEGN